MLWAWKQEWPPHSYDLNPIQNTWGNSKCSDLKLHSELASNDNWQMDWTALYEQSTIPSKRLITSFCINPSSQVLADWKLFIVPGVGTLDIDPGTVFD
jgi:hypothetical protein